MKNSNIEIITSTNSINRSYGYAYKSKVVCAFGSTMILECLGHNKKAFFLDPNNHGQQFYYYLNQIKKYRISKYKDFEKTMLNELKLKNRQKISNKVFCLKSDSVSQNCLFIEKTTKIKIILKFLFI